MKQKARSRRGPTPGATHRPHAGWAPGPQSDEFVDEIAEELSQMFGDLLDDAEPSFLDPPPRGTVTERAQHLLDRWLSTARRQADGGVLRIWAEHQLRSVDDAVLVRADELLGHRLLADVAGLWNGGWQPRDLLHVVQRIDRRTVALTADLAIEQLRRTGRLDRAPDAWREQLADAAERAASAGLRPLGDRPWTPLARLTSAGAAGAEAVSSVLRLIVRLEELPVLVTTLPPPSSWRSGPSAPRSSASGSAASASTADGRRDKVLSTIRALLAKAESTEHAAEAEALTAKAQALMTRHAIDEALLHAASDEAIDVRSHRVLIDSPYPFEKVTLLNAVGKTNRVRVIWMETLAIATVVGTPVDVDQTELLFTSLLIQATRAMAEAGAARAGSFDRSPSFRRAFLTSYAYRIGERLAEADTEAAASYGTELVPVLKRQQEAVDEEFDRLFPNTYETSGRRAFDPRGWQAGRAAADDAVFVAGRLAG
jgi:hypothetical protein